MKIIASTNDGYLIEATKDEVYNIIGQSGYYGSDKVSTDKVGINKEIHIAEMYQYVAKIAKRQGAIEKIIEVMEHFIEEIKPYARKFPDAEVGRDLTQIEKQAIIDKTMK